MAPAGTSALDISVPIEDAVKAPVVVAVPVKGVCGSEVEWVRSGGAEIEEDVNEVVNVDSWVSPPLGPPLGCFFGDATAEGSEINRLNKMALFQIMTMVFPGCFEDSGLCSSEYNNVEIFVLLGMCRKMLDIAYSIYCTLLATFRQYSKHNPKKRH